MTRDETERCTILRGLVGSTAHGLNVNDGIEDRDEMGVCIEPLDAAMSVTSTFEQFIYRSAAEREGRSSPAPVVSPDRCERAGVFHTSWRAGTAADGPGDHEPAGRRT